MKHRAAMFAERILQDPLIDVAELTISVSTPD
jgi:hypothetical protein